MTYKDSKQYIKSVSAFNGGVNLPTNAPTQYKERHTQYMAGRTATFDANRAYLSTNYINADVQGLVSEDFYEWCDTHIRLSEIQKLSTSKRMDDYKQVLFPEIDIDYFPLGAKIRALGSTWICVNPLNIVSAKTTAIVARCNSSYNSYDYYGNVVTEPIVVESNSMLGNENSGKDNIVLMSGSFNVTCQLNENTAVLQENSRIILGRKAYHITGLTDFIQEFTGDRNSCHLLSFTIRVEEPTESDDITTNFIANGDEYEFDCILQGADNIGIGEKVLFIPHFIKNGEAVESTDKKPITWEWETTDSAVASIDMNGMVTALDSGYAQITARMVQNPSIVATANLTVINEKHGGDSVAFTSIVPESISQYDSVVIMATYKENGLATYKPLKWSFSGAKKEDYSAVVSQDGTSVEIICLSPCNKNLKVTASYNGKSATAEIALIGY